MSSIEMFLCVLLTFFCSVIQQNAQDNLFVDEIICQLKDSKTKYIFTVEQLVETAKKATSECHAIRVGFFLIRNNSLCRIIPVLAFHIV